MRLECAGRAKGRWVDGGIQGETLTGQGVRNSNLENRGEGENWRTLAERSEVECGMDIEQSLSFESHVNSDSNTPRVPGKSEP